MIDPVLNPAPRGSSLIHHPSSLLFAFRLAAAALLVNQGERWARLYEEIIVKGGR